MALTLLAFNNCSDVRLSLTPPVVVKASSGALCMAPPESLIRYSKVLFIMDKSGSNTIHDPDDVRRADNVQAFLDKHKDDPYYRFGYIAFGIDGNKAVPYIADGDLNPVFREAPELQAAIDRHRAEGDTGCTPYLAALGLAKSAIEKDIIDHPEEDNVYNIFFMSDGFPNDANTASGCASNVAVTNSPDDPYISAVKDIVTIAPERTFLSTAYYTPSENDPGRQAARGLEYMAEAGNGHFVDLQNNDKLDFEEMKLGERPEAWVLKRLVVYNINSGFCTDGTVDVDSDGDGLCDKDEDHFNNIFADKLNELGVRFDKLNRNSINPKFADSISYKLEVLPSGEGLNECNLNKPDRDFDLLNDCEERALLDSQANGPTPQWTAEMRNSGGGAADPLNPDTDGDGFLDSLEFFQFQVKSVAVDYTNITDRHLGGVTSETLMTEHRHPMIPEEFAKTSYDTQVRFTGINSQGQNCYDFKMEQLALYPTEAVTLEQVSELKQLQHEANENIVLIYYITTPERDPNGKGYLYHSYQRISYGGGADGLRLDKFKPYKVPAVPLGL
ncbi:MAG: VWA domain-containing protein [Bdellovibrionales bacterium]|nr:VWA domain-containing protein [Bdellovibrionales bacterium]